MLRRESCGVEEGFFVLLSDMPASKRYSDFFRCSATSLGVTSPFLLPYC